MKRVARYAAPALLASLLIGCAAPPATQARSYITLLPSPDGTVGQVLVRGSGGEQRITQARFAAPLDGSRPPAAVDEAAFQRDFAAAIAARPALPQHFVLYFETGTAQLTPVSQALLPQIVATTRQRASADMSITGHSDTVGPAEQNVALSLKRAQAVAELLQGTGLNLEALTVESHGERNLLVPTPDETPEPRNRRVEVTVR
jgi:outer membrane protein OmpA-like peptidoglycan-associated protein